MIGRVIHFVVLLHGWQRAVFSMAMGALGALAMPPFGFFPALSIALTAAVWLLDGAVGPRGARIPALRQAFAIGWFFGFGYFLAGLWWIGSAFLVDADQFAVLLPFAVLALPAGLALFHGIAFALARLVWLPHPVRILILAVTLGLAEYARGHVLTGFPWNALGYALAGEVHLAQILSLIGLPALTFVAIAILAAPATLGDESRWRWRVPAIALATLAAIAAFGAWRLSGEPAGMVEGVKLRIMQPAIAQDAKFRPQQRDTILRTYRDLSDRTIAADREGLAGVTHLIWPESAFPFIVSRDADALAQIAELLPPGAVLITGAGRADDPLPGESERRFFNSVHVIDSTGAILGTYDKVHLVPFGEYLPFQAVLERWGLRQLTKLPGGFTAGTRRRTMEIPNVPPVGILICYEAIFPGSVVDPTRRPGWLLNVTNDGWFGITPGPYQHLTQARARAIEEGLPLVRAANTGISAVFDARGRWIAGLDLGVVGVFDSPLPIADPPTPYARAGDVGVIVFLILSISLIAVTMYRLPRTAFV